jgi:bacterioferritin-associated ferredoxin
VIVCLCRNVSDRAVSAAMDAGARSAAEIALATGGAGTQCGCCSDAIAAMLARPPPCANACPGCTRRDHGEAAAA